MGRPLPHTHFVEQPAPCPGSLEEQPPPSASRADSPGLARTWREGRVSASEAARPRAQGGLGDSAGGGGDGQGSTASADDAPAALLFTGPGCSAFAQRTGACVGSRGNKEKRLAGRRNSLLESSAGGGSTDGPAGLGAHATQGVSSPSLSQGAGRAQDAGGNPSGCDVKRPGGLCPGAVCPRHCPKAIAPVRLHPHPCSMFSPAAKQETSAGPWIHYVNKYTEDFRAFEGNRVFGRKPGPAQPAFLAEKPVQAAGQPGPA